MERKFTRTINEVLDCETGECIDANEFFKKPLDELTVYRSELQKAIEGIRENLFVCYYCKQKIRIRGGIASPHKRKAEIFHFAHLKDSDECHIKTKNYYTREEVDRIKYNGAKESTLHQTLKDQIAECLQRNEETIKDVSSIEVEKVIRNKVANEWKKPDINAFYHDKRIAIELQLSTTWLDVITRRQHFYKDLGIYMFWVFYTFDSNDDIRKLTYNDVIYTNNQNAYIFNKETYELSQLENNLVLKCYYKVYYRDEQRLCEEWEYCYIKLSDLTFDEQNHRIYYHDTETQKKSIEQEIENYTSQLRESGRLKIIQEQEITRKRQEIETKMQDLNDEIKGINESKKEIEQNEIKANSKLNKLKEFEVKVPEYVDKTINHFKDSRSFFKPFFDHDELLKSLKEDYAERTKTAYQSISDKSQVQASLAKDLLEISKLRVMEISGRTYSIIDEFANWDFIKQYQTQFKSIHKNFVNGLFAEEEINSVKNVLTFKQILYLKDMLFLIDFSSETLVLNEKIKNNQEIIENQETIITDIKEGIKRRFEIYLKESIVNVESKLRIYSDRQAKLNNEIAKKEKELKNLEQKTDNI